jgi:anti-anti-sigma factor
MKVTVDNRENAVICHIDGEINIGTTEELKKPFKQIVDSRPKKVILDFKRVGYIDSLGMATVIGFLKELQKIGAALGVTELDPKIYSIFKITKVDKVLKIFNSQEDAIKGL